MITYIEFRKAKKIINDYYKQEAKKKPYGFLYYVNEEERTKNIKADNIEQAVKKFLKSVNLTNNIKVDYEVSYNNTFIDISDIEEIKEYLS